MRIRLLAVALELAPLSAFMFVRGSNAGLTVGIAAAAMTGVGWAVMGRWDTGFVIAIARWIVIAIAFLIYGAISVGFGIANLNCEDCYGVPIPETVAEIMLILAYVVTALASAFLLARAAWRTA